MNEKRMRWKDLVADLLGKFHGNKTMLASRIGISDAREVRRWLRGATPHARFADLLFKECERFGINPRKYEGLEPVYNFKNSYEQNLIEGPQGLSLTFEEFIPKVATPSFLDYNLNSPIGVPSSVLTTNFQWIRPLIQRGYDVVTLKTVKTREVPAHHFPNVAYLPELQSPLQVGSVPKEIVGIPDLRDENVAKLSLANSFGLPSPKPGEWQEDWRKSLRLLSTGQILIGSVVGTADSPEDDLIADFVQCARWAHEVGVHAVELNFSCPNVYGKEGFVYKNAELSGEICKKVARAIPNAKILVKIGYLPTDQLKKLFDATFKNIHGYTAINALPAKIISSGQRAVPLFSRKNLAVAGLSGVAIKEYALDAVRGLRRLATSANRPDIGIIGVGGISSLDDVNRFREAGANCVQICTAALLNPLIAVEIRKQLNRASFQTYSRTFDRPGATPIFSDPIRKKAFENLEKVYSRLGVDFFDAIEVLEERWFKGYKRDLENANQSVGSPRLRAEAPTEAQIEAWIREKNK